MLIKKLRVFANDDLEVEELSLGLYDCFGGDIYVLIQKYLLPLSLVDVIAHIKGLTSSTSFVEQRGITELQASEFLHHCLIVDEGLQPSLGDFGLIGSICSVPPWIFEQIALYDCGRDGGIVASSDVAFEKLVFINYLPHLVQELMLGDSTADEVVLQSSLI